MLFVREMLVAILLAASLVACNEDPTNDSCESYASPTVLAKAPQTLDEISGLVVSRDYCGIAWVHNDSGDHAQIYALDMHTGKLVSTVQLDKVAAVDFEAISMSECEEGWCLFVGDIGDNPHRRTNIAIHRLKEPNPYASAIQTVPVKTMTARYELGPWDAEALLSVGEELYILSKEMGFSRFYNARFAEGEGHTFELIETIRWSERLTRGGMRLITGADYAENPPRVILRAYFSIHEFIGEEGDDIPTILSRESRSLPAGFDFQGEAVGYGPGGFYHAPEAVGAPINFSGCVGSELPTCGAPQR